MTDRPHPPPVLLSEALAAIRSQLSGRRDQEAVPLSHATGRILAADLISGVDLPHRDSSAVDGFAVRSADLAPGGSARLSLIGEAAAGHPFHGIIGQGQAVRVFTGASIPQGADLVVMQEKCAADGAGVEVRWDGRGRTHIRPRGEDIASGTKVIGAGSRLGTCDVALAGALGCTRLGVFKRLRVGVFSTGDELREPGEPLGNGQVWDANRCLLRGLLERMGCEVADFGILRDEPRALEGALSAAARDCDLLVTSGGMSVGREDHMRSIIGRRGTLDLWPVAIKPGRPVGVGDIDACPILALPGNPVAAVVAFVALGRTVVNVLARAADEPLAEFMLPAGFAFEKRQGVRQYLLSNIRLSSDGTAVAVPCEKQGTAMLSTLGAMDGLIVLEEGRSLVREGEPVAFLPARVLMS